MQELKIDLAEAIKMWDGTNTQKVIQAPEHSKTNVTPIMCYEELQKDCWE